MDSSVNPHHIEAIKTQTLSVSGFENLTPADCRSLSFLIMAKTKLSVSETSVKRIFGFAKANFDPSQYTLNALAIYCGYKGWEDFSAVQPRHISMQGVFPLEVFDNPLISVLLDTPIPTAVLKADAPYFTVITYNKAYEDAAFIKRRNIRGSSLLEAFNLTKAGGSGPALLLDALHRAVHAKQTVKAPPLHYNIPSEVSNVSQLSWWDIKIVPVIVDGFVTYLVINSYNITDKVLNQDAIEDAIMKELTMAEDLAKTNVKLNKALDNLAESHRELTETKIKLEELNTHLEDRVTERTKDLIKSEARQRELINSAPVAIGILKGPDHIVETANTKILEYWAKDKSAVGKPLAVAIPELDGQPFITILDEVRNSGVAYANPELRAFLEYNGALQPRYFDMIYQPVQHFPGITDSIYIVAIDITEHVLARKKLQESESMLRLAVTAAKIGIWSLEPRAKTLTYNSIFADILGWDGPGDITYDRSIAKVAGEFQTTLIELVDGAIAENTGFDFTYQQERFNDGKMIWLRATGKVSHDDEGAPCFSGIIRDITNEVSDADEIKKHTGEPHK